MSDNPHALVIEDDRTSARVINNLLLVNGITSTTVERPEDVDSVLSSIPETHLVFLDLSMPNINGYLIFEKLRQLPQFQGVPIVACTVYADEIHQAREVGFHSFITKPLNPTRFKQHLAKLLANEPVWDRGS